MAFQKITNFFDKSSGDKDLPGFVTKNCIDAYDQSQGNYDANKGIRINTLIIRSDLCDFNDAYISVTGNITVIEKSFTAADFERPNNTYLNATNTNNAKNNTFGEKKVGF